MAKFFSTKGYYSVFFINSFNFSAESASWLWYHLLVLGRINRVSFICVAHGSGNFPGLMHRKFYKKRKAISDSTDDRRYQHEGIKTVGVDDLCRDKCSDTNLHVCMVTWNMNGQVSYEDLKHLIGTDRKFHLLVVGLQEAPRKNISRLLKAALVETHILLGKAIMQSLQLYVFGLRSSSESFINEIKVDKQGVGGLGGLIRRKKGAVAIRIDFRDVQMVFISCHLSAHASNVEERNSQCRHISHSLFSKNQNPNSRPAQITVWLGDLNYRIDGIDTHPARNLIRRNQHALLTSKDQLLQEAERGQVFNGYCEGTLAFKPTYKYNVGSSNYDTSYKVRAPAWTDRILFRIEDTDKINATLQSYESIEGVYSSDHKPVKAHLCLKVN